MMCMGACYCTISSRYVIGHR